MTLIFLFQGSISHTINLIARTVRGDGDEIDIRDWIRRPTSACGSIAAMYAS
jgi:hypothetical protein